THLPGARAADRDVPGDVRDPADGRLARAVARGSPGPGAEDRPPAADLRRRQRAGFRGDRGPAARSGPGTGVAHARRGGPATAAPLELVTPNAALRRPGASPPLSQTDMSALRSPG